LIQPPRPPRTPRRSKSIDKKNGRLKFSGLLYFLIDILILFFLGALGGLGG
jgi:hypothetical protein